MSAVSAEEAGRRVEQVLDRLAQSGDGAARAAAEDVVRVLMEFYGSGLARIVALLEGQDGVPGGRPPADPRAALLGDALVASLLTLHGLHPEDAQTRIGRALSGLPQPVENAGFDPADGVLRLRVAAASGCGCPSTLDATRQAAVDALACFAPEVTGVELETAGREPALLQIGAGPPPVAAGAGNRGGAA
jgi:hypothetical protein